MAVDITVFGVTATGASRVLTEAQAVVDNVGNVAAAVQAGDVGAVAWDVVSAGADLGRGIANGTPLGGILGLVEDFGAAALGGGLSGLGDAVIGKVTDTLNDVTGQVTAVGAALQGFVGAVGSLDPGAILGAVGDVVGAIGGLIRDVADAIGLGPVADALGDLAGAIGGLFAFLGRLVSGVENAGEAAQAADIEAAAEEADDAVSVVVAVADQELAPESTEDDDKQPSDEDPDPVGTGTAAGEPGEPGDDDGLGNRRVVVDLPDIEQLIAAGGVPDTEHDGDGTRNEPIELTIGHGPHTVIDHEHDGDGTGRVPVEIPAGHGPGTVDAGDLGDGDGAGGHPGHGPFGETAVERLTPGELSAITEREGESG
jgi:hypothetical protein